MPIKINVQDKTDVIEAQNGLRWLKRELQIFKDEPAKQEAIMNNILKLTYLKVEVDG